MTDRTNATIRYLDELTRRTGAHRAVVASADGLLVAGSTADADALEELAAYAPSQLPTKVQRPAGMSTRRIEIGGERLYVATLGGEPPPEAVADLARILDR